MAVLRLDQMPPESVLEAIGALEEMMTVDLLELPGR